MKSVVSGIILLIIGGVIGYWVAGGFKPQTRNFTVLDGGSVFYSPMAGDVLTWQGQDHKTPVNVTFQDSPCAEDPVGGASIPKCTINKYGGLYAYSCENNACADPGVNPGSKNGGSIGGLGGVPTNAAEFNAEIPTIVCRNGVAMLFPKDQKAQVGDTITWLSTGINWSITLTDGTLCKEGATFSQDGHNICHVATLPATNPLPYTTTVQGCKQPDATGTINVTP